MFAEVVLSDWRSQSIPGPPSEEPMIGTKLAHYRILKKIGEGGMGEVFVAEDERLKRHVALKVLNDDSALDRTRSARFHRETKAVAAINHPNVVTLYSVEEFDGKRFLAMEWVEGEILSEVVLEGTLLSLSRFLDYAIPLVEGVKAAHDLGIAHRDLKPRNVMIDKEGRVKLLDFGLARWRERDQSREPEVTDVLTLTRTGAVLGTPAYMSPEQLRGKGVDHRTDLFSIGVMFYEMLAGARPYRGDTPTEMATSILRDDPPKLTVYRTDLPRRVQRLLDRCLEKKTEDRYQSADELLADLKELQRESQIAELSASLLASPGQRRFKWLAWASFVLVPVLVGALVWVWWWSGAGSRPVETQTTTLVMWVGEVLNAQLSPDGNWLSFLSNRDGPWRLYLQRVHGGGEPRVVESVRANALGHLWSSNGEDFAVLSQYEDQVHLLLAPVFGDGPKQSVLLPASYSSGSLVRWLENAIYIETEEGLHRLNLTTSELELLLTRETAEGWRSHFDVSPDERSVVFLRRKGDDVLVWKSRIDGSREQRLTERGVSDTTPRFLGPQGRRVVFQSTLGGRPDIWFVDVKRAGRPQALSVTALDKSLLFASTTSRLLLVRERSRRSALHLVTASGLEPLTDETTVSSSPSVERHGTRLAFLRTDPRLSRNLFPFGSQIYVGELHDSRIVGAEMEVDEGAAPRLSPDGRFLTYWQRNEGRVRLMMRDLGVHDERLLSDRLAIPAYKPYFSAWAPQQVAWSPDSTTLYFVSADLSGRAANLYRWRRDDRVPAFFWTFDGREVGDIHVSPSNEEIAFLVSANFRDGSDATLVRRNVETGAETQLQLSGRFLNILGWRESGRIVLGRSSLNSDFTDNVQVLESVPSEPILVLGELPQTRRGAVLLSENELVFPSRDENTGIYNLYGFSLETRRTRPITRNNRPGIRLTGVQKVKGDIFLVALEEPLSMITLHSFDREASSGD